MSTDTRLGEDERIVGFPHFLTDSAIDYVKAEGLRQAAAVLTEGHQKDHPVYDPTSCDVCAVAMWLDSRSNQLEEEAHEAEAEAFARGETARELHPVLRVDW